jgi:hypothetical protein
MPEVKSHSICVIYILPQKFDPRRDPFHNLHRPRCGFKPDSRHIPNRSLANQGRAALTVLPDLNCCLLTTHLYRCFDFWHSGTRNFHQHRVVFGISGSFLHIAEPLRHIAEPLRQVAKSPRQVAKSFRQVAKPLRHIAKWIHHMSLTMLIRPLANQDRAALPRHLDI